MEIPGFQDVMRPMLEALADGQTRSSREVTNGIADHFGLSEEDRDRRVPSGQQTLIGNRVAWAKSHLKMAGLLEYPGRGLVRISDLGRRMLADNPARIDVRLLRQFPGYREFIGKAEPEAAGAVAEPVVEEQRTPLELIDASFKTLWQATTEELLSRLRACSPGFFEDMVVKLLLAMGYGGVAGHGTVTGRSGDAGIDGVIRQDKLGLDVVSIQAKRWEGVVGRPVVQGFVGSMDFIRARKGVILTTSSFSREALEFVDRIEGKKVVLIDGDRLAELMIEHGLGVITRKVYELREVSNDFFDESET